ncbi:MAG TPA: Ig-like domain-containing protein, partial [Gemmatimonadales bacterium]|nr:Ig-like domain-containing protein [Gemmatimonadales bacterium]
MRFLAAAAAVSLAGFATVPSPQLGVLRSSPADGADPTAIVSVAFDRPVAGQLDGTVDPKSIFSISPVVPGLVEWQDPITIRFTPSAPFAAGRTYTVTVANTFQAMDGSRLAEPYRYSFRVSGPRVLSGQPAGPGLNPPYLKPDAVFELVISTPVDLDVLSRLVYLELARTCGGAGAGAGAGAPIVRLKPVTARPITDKDVWNLREAGGWQRNRGADPLRRVVRLVPEHPLPLACDGWVIVPASIDSTSTTPGQRWPFSVYRPLKLLEVLCITGP